MTSKKPAVDCSLTHPYLIADCLSRSSTFLMADSFLLDVRNAVQLAVYDCVTINAKNHHIDAHTLVEKALKRFRTVDCRYRFIDIYKICRLNELSTKGF